MREPPLAPRCPGPFELWRSHCERGAGRDSAAWDFSQLAEPWGSTFLQDASPGPRETCPAHPGSARPALLIETRGSVAPGLSPRPAGHGPVPCGGSGLRAD